MELGEKLRQARMNAGLSQRQLCGEVITRNMLSLIEHGSAKPSMETLKLLADRLGLVNGKFRQKIDIGLVTISVVLTLIFGTEWTLREGTIIAALIFGPSMDLVKKTFFTSKTSV